MAEIQRRESRTKLYRYAPYPKQLRFHEVGGVHEPGPDCPPGCTGAPHRERLLMGSNQSGKSYCGAAEPAFHATGLYDMAAKIKFPAGHPRAGELAFPNGWTGKRFKRPTRGWLGGDGYEGIRDGLQRLLVGPPAIEEEWGTGMIPADLLLDWSRAGGGVPNVLSTILVRHATGGVSSIGFKSYDQGRRKWQGETLDYVGFDEEPPPEIYSEGLTRTNATGGIAWMTFTPLQGMTEVVSQFIDDVGGLR